MVVERLQSRLDAFSRVAFSGFSRRERGRRYIISFVAYALLLNLSRDTSLTADGRRRRLFLMAADDDVSS